MNEICVGRPNHFEWGEVSTKRENADSKTTSSVIPSKIRRLVLATYFSNLMHLYIANIGKYSQYMPSDTPAYTEVSSAMNELRHFTYAASASNTFSSIFVRSY